MKTIQDYRKKLTEYQGRKTLLDEQLQKTVNIINTKNIKLKATEKAQAFIQKVAKETQEQLRFRISDIVNLALDAVFPNKYTFTVNFEIKRNKTEAALLFMEDDKEIDPMEASGGGVVDLTAFALRIAVWCLGKTDNVIILDEPFKWIQPKELHNKALQIIKELSNKLHIQFIIVSNSVNNEEMINIADKIFKITMINKISEVEERTAELEHSTHIIRKKPICELPKQ